MPLVNLTKPVNFNFKRLEFFFKEGRYKFEKLQGQIVQEGISLVDGSDRSFFLLFKGKTEAGYTQLHSDYPPEEINKLLSDFDLPEYFLKIIREALEGTELELPEVSASQPSVSSSARMEDEPSTSVKVSERVIERKTPLNQLTFLTNPGISSSLKENLDTPNGRKALAGEYPMLTIEQAKRLSPERLKLLLSNNGLYLLSRKLISSYQIEEMEIEKLKILLSAQGVKAIAAGIVYPEGVHRLSPPQLLFSIQDEQLEKAQEKFGAGFKL
jgi:hypothetical protein